MKKIYSFIISALFIFSSYFSNAQTCEVTIGDVYGKKAGDTVLIPVFVKGFKNVGALAFSIMYKNNVLTSIDGDQKHITNINPIFLSSTSNILSTLDTGWSEFVIVWQHIPAVDLADGTKLFDLTFIFLGGSTSLCFSKIDPRHSQIVDYDTMEDIPVLWNCGHVTDQIDYCKAAFNINSGSDQFTYNFSDVSSGNYISEHLWDFGDGITSTEANPTHTYTDPGFYNVCLSIKSTASGNVVCTDNICQKFFIQNYIPQYNCRAFFRNSFQDTLTGYKFNDLSDGVDIAKWDWDFGDNSTSTEQNPVHKYINSGTYNVCLKVTSVKDGNDVCQNTYCEKTYVYVNPPQSDYQCSATFYSLADTIPHTFYFTGYAGSNYPVEWLWDFGDGNTSYEHVVKHKFNNAGKYTVCLKITAFDNGTEVCNNTYCNTIDVDNTINPPPSYCFNQFTYRITDTTSTSFDADFLAFTKADKPLQYAWDFGDGSSDNVTDNSISHTFTKQDNIDVCLTTTPVANPSSCTFTTCQTVIGKTDNSFCFGNLSGQVFNGNTPCQMAYVAIVRIDKNSGGAIKYFDLRQADANGYYSFSFIPYGYFYVFAFPNPASPDFNKYLPTFYGDTWNWEDAQTVLVGHQSSTNTNIHLVALYKKKSAKGSGCISGTVFNGNKSFSNSIYNDQAEIILLDNNNRPVSFVFADSKGAYSFKDLGLGDYKVAVHSIGIKTQMSSASLTDLKSCFENVNFQSDSPIFELPSIITSTDNLAKFNNTCGEVYPNPVNDIASVNVSYLAAGSNDLKITIYNNIGQMVYSASYKPVTGKQTLRFNTASMESGIYFVKISGNDFNAVRKFIKVR